MAGAPGGSGARCPLCQAHSGRTNHLRYGVTVAWCATCGDRFCRHHIQQVGSEWVCRTCIKRAARKLAKA